MKEVRQVYRSPTQTEKGKKSEEEGIDAHPEEVSDVEMHIAMEQLFQERPKSISQGIPIPQSSSSSSPNLPLVLYQPLSEFFVKLHELSKLHSIRSPAVTRTSSRIASGTVSQPRTNSFILVTPTQVNMAGSLTQYLEFSGKGNDDFEKHWYVY